MRPVQKAASQQNEEGRVTPLHERSPVTQADACHPYWRAGLPERDPRRRWQHVCVAYALDTFQTASIVLAISPCFAVARDEP